MAEHKVHLPPGNQSPALKQVERKSANAQAVRCSDRFGFVLAMRSRNHTHNAFRFEPRTAKSQLLLHNANRLAGSVTTSLPLQLQGPSTAELKAHLPGRNRNQPTRAKMSSG